MKRSTERILTTHVGSLPRPPDLLEFLEAREAGRAVEQAAFDACLAASVHEVVKKQVAAGIDSVCDGELGKISYTFYVRHRLSGIGAFRGGANDQPPQTAAHRDLLDHPDFHARLNQKRGGTSWFSREAVPCCTGPVAYQDRRPLAVDLANLADACAAAKPNEAFMNAASPGVLTKFVPDRLLPRRRRLCRSARRRAEGGIRGDPPRRLYPADRRARPRLGPAQSVPAPLRRRIPAHRRAQHRGAQPRDRQHPARGDAHAPVLGQLRGPAHPRHPARHDFRRDVAGAAVRAVLRGGQPAPRP